MGTEHAIPTIFIPAHEQVKRIPHASWACGTTARRDGIISTRRRRRFVIFVVLVILLAEEFNGKFTPVGRCVHWGCARRGLGWWLRLRLLRLLRVLLLLLRLLLFLVLLLLLLLLLVLLLLLLLQNFSEDDGNVFACFKIERGQQLH